MAWVADLERMDSISSIKKYVKEAVQSDPEEMEAEGKLYLCDYCKAGPCCCLRSVAGTLDYLLSDDSGLKPLSYFFPPSHNQT